jgi:hypothetical protein
MAKSELQYFMEIQRKVMEREYSILQACLQKCGKQALPFSSFALLWIHLRGGDFRQWFAACKGEMRLDTFQYRPDYFRVVLFSKPNKGSL